MTKIAYKENGNKGYKHMEAYGKVMCSNGWWIEQEQWRAFYMDAPIDTICFDGEGLPVQINDLTNDGKKAVKEFMI